MPITKASKRAFTLIELLAVMAIMTLLAALLLTAVMRARVEAWRAKAKDEAHQVVVAWNAYLLDHRTFPTNVGCILEMNSNTIAILNRGSRYNQFTPYMEFNRDQLARGMRDRWDNLFQVALDAGLPPRDTGPAYDGEVTAGAHGKVRKSVAVWTAGPDGVEGNEDDCTSWPRKVEK